MDNQAGLRPPDMEQSDSSTPSQTADSAQFERPRPRRRIDCGGNPEIADRPRMPRGGPVSDRQQ